MEKEILETIHRLDKFDGVYYEMFINNHITIEKGKDIVRVIVADGKVMAHVLDVNDNTEFVYFNNLPKSIQLEVYADVCGHKICDLDEFFDWVKGYLDNGDKIVVRYEETENGEEDYDHLVYSVKNSCDDVLFEYSALNHLLKSY